MFAEQIYPDQLKRAKHLTGPIPERTAGAAGEPEPEPEPSYPTSRATSFILWRQEWTLNVDFMDEDHRCLAAILNHIAPDLRSCAGGGWNWAFAARLMSRLETLGAHTREHFQREEQAMRDSDYPAFAQHKAEHDLLLAEYTVMLRDIRSAGLQSLELGTLEALKQWLIGHVLDDDKALADYLLSNAEAAAIAGLSRHSRSSPQRSRANRLDRSEWLAEADSSAALHRLFPQGGPQKQGNRLAGLLRTKGEH